MIPKAVVFDLDGTVLNSKKEISKRNIKAISSLQSKNIHTIFATARPPRVTSFKGFDKLSRDGYMVYYNGAYFKCTKTLDDCHFGIEPAVAAEVIDYIEALDEDAVVTVEIKDNLYGYKDIEYGVLDFMKKDYHPEIVEMEFLKSQELTKILIADFDYPAELAERFAEELNIIVTDGGRLVQVMSSQVGKEIAIAAIARNLGITIKDIMCFGDDYNDLELFRAAGHSVAMGNAVDDLKEIASEVTLTNDEDGVAVVLERILGELGDKEPE
jgi:Cof subfamily protein (haloacid dehalogenase superfamily)